MTRFLIILIAVWLAQTATAATRYVSTNGAVPDGEYLTWATAATNIQDAVFAAAGNDTVLVTNGAYGVTNQIMVTNNITVQSVNGYSNTLVYAAGSPYTTRCFSVTGTGVLDGFTISNGYANADGGGGVYCAKSLIQNCYIVSNYTTNCNGGGVYLSSGTMITCRVVGNIATGFPYYGGGVYGGTLSNCTLTGNSAGYCGGGVYGGTLYNCTLISNSAPAGYGGGVRGGALYNCTLISNSAANYGGGAFESTLLSNCTLTGNSAAKEGGGAHKCTLYNCTLISNSAGTYGGGAYLYAANILSNCLLTGNSAGGGGGGAAGGTLYNCTLTGNSAGLAGGASGSTLYNCTLTGNSATNSDGGGTYGSTLSNCLLTGNSAANIGGGVLLRDGSLVQYCTIVSNSAASGGGGAGLRGNGATLHNCLISSNSAPEAGGVYGWAGVNLNSLVENCTIVNNKATGSAGGGGITYHSDGAANTGIVCNTIIYSNTAPASAASNANWVLFSPYSYFSNNCTTPTNGLLGTKNITNNPMFMNVIADNYRLTNGSPCINTGTNQSWMTGATDLDGHRRLDHLFGLVDMGAYEHTFKGTFVSMW